MPFFMTSIAVMGTTYLITMKIENVYLLIAIRIIIAATLYFAVMKLAHVVILDDCIKFVKQKFSK